MGKTHPRSGRHPRPRRGFCCVLGATPASSPEDLGGPDQSLLHSSTNVPRITTRQPVARRLGLGCVPLVD